MEDMGWYAGFIEGEGSMTVQQSGGIPSTIRVEVSNSDRTLLEPFLQFGGSIYDWMDAGTNNIMYKWSVAGMKARNLLVQVRPHFKGRVTTWRAELLLRFPLAGRRVSESVFDTRKQIFQELNNGW